MSLAAAGVVPAAPLLVPGMSARPPAELDAVRAAAASALRELPGHDLLVLLAGAPSEDAAGVWAHTEADLGGLSRPDLRAGLTVPEGLAESVAAALGLAVRRGPLPVDLAVLALQAAGARGGLPAAVLPVAVPWSAGAELPELGRRLLAAVPPEHAVVVVAAGDLSAGLTEKAPRHLVDGAGEWDVTARDALSRCDAAGLAALGPDEAARVAGRGWPALVALLGLLDAAGVALGAVDYAAPRGVGYVVARTCARA